MRQSNLILVGTPSELLGVYDPCAVVWKDTVIHGELCSLNVLRGSSIGTATSKIVTSFMMACLSRLIVHSELFCSLARFLCSSTGSFPSITGVRRDPKDSSDFPSADRPLI